jgi:hypothetical protein
MTDEMAQELMRLPRYTAYAKIIEDQDGEQRVKMQEIKTYPLSALPEKPKEYFEQVKEIFETNPIKSGYAIAKEQIEAEIRQRQEQWLRPASSDAPPQKTKRSV